jgi:hypothetical protein
VCRDAVLLSLLVTGQVSKAAVFDMDAAADVEVCI